MVEYDKIPALKRAEEIFSLRDRVIVIAGGAGKMGQNFAEVMSNAGGRVYLLDLDEERCRTTAAGLSEKAPTRITGIGCDLATEGEVLKAFQTVVGAEGRLDVLIYNVYAKPPGYYRKLEAYEVETWERVMRTNVTGAFVSSREAIKVWKKNRTQGNIILTLSTYGLVGPDLRIYEGLSASTNIYGGDDPLTTPLPYTVSKSGLLGMVKYLATSCGRFNIRVNALSPGGVYDNQEEAFHKAYVDRVPLGRMATWSEYNGAILFLASDASRYMTGANLVVDGGWTAW